MELSFKTTLTLSTVFPFYNPLFCNSNLTCRSKFSQKIQSDETTRPRTLICVCEGYKDLTGSSRRESNYQNMDLPPILPKNKKKPYPIPIKKIHEAARADKELAEKGIEKHLEPPKNGLLVTELVPLSYEVLEAWKFLIKGVAQLLHIVPVYGCSLCPEVHVGQNAHMIQNCTGSGNPLRKGYHTWVKGSINDVLLPIESYHLYDPFGRRVKHETRFDYARIPAVVELCIQAGVELPDYPSRRRTQPIRMLGKKVTHRGGFVDDLKPYLSKDSSSSLAELDTYGIHTGTFPHPDTAFVQTLAQRTLKAYDTVKFGVHRLVKKYPVKACGYCSEIHVGPWRHFNCKTFFHCFINSKTPSSSTRFMSSLLRLRCLSLLKQGGLSLNLLKQIHNQLVVNGFNYQGKLIEGYSALSDKNGINYARLVFKHTEKPHLYVWNVMIRCLPPKEAIRVFADGSKISDLVFDEFGYVYVLGACARWVSKEGLFAGKQIHGKMFKVGFVSDVEMQTTGIYFYASHGDCRSARKVFDEMLERSSATWNAMISCYCSQKKKVTYNSHEALKLFCELLRDGSDVKPNGTTMVSVLSACSRLGDLMTGSCVHGHIEKSMPMPLQDVYIGTCLVEMYSKCGCLSSAMSAFNLMKVKNILTWTSMLSGLAIHGRGKEALEKLDAMQATNIKPNEVTFTSLLFACCHVGLVEEGLHLFHSMTSKFGVIPRIQHYGCIVDLLGRAGKLQEAYDFVNEMSIPPDAIMWRSLLAACNIHEDVGMGEKVGKHLLVLQKERDKNESETRCEDFIALSNVYASAERWEELEMVRKMMRGKGIQIKPGSSSVQLM